MKRCILVVDDDELLRDLLLSRLGAAGFEVLGAGSLAEARALLQARSPDLGLLDMQLPDGKGLELVEELRQRCGCESIVITSHATVETAVDSLRHGVRDFLEKPFSMERLINTVQSALQISRMDRQLKALHVERKRASGSMVAASPKMLDLLKTIDMVAASEGTTVLIEGETGTGKGMIARHIHERSPLADGPFLTVTCSSLAETVIESELFGHEKGSFTDAHARKRGLVELAHGGTLFFDEIGELPLRLQGKLLEFLEERTFRRLGGTQELRVKARILAATNRDLRAEVDKGSFRADLYFRLQVVPLRLPPLRERPEDVEVLSRHFLARFAAEMDRPVKSIGEDALKLLLRHEWPGNVRELRNAIERGVLMSTGDRLGAESLPADLRGELPRSMLLDANGNLAVLPDRGVDLEKLERRLLEQALARRQGNRTEAGRLLGLSRHQVRQRLKKFGLVALAWMGLSAMPAEAQDLECLRCHSSLEFLDVQGFDDTRVERLLVDSIGEAHEALECSDCHDGFVSVPHPLDEVSTLQCEECHDDVAEWLAESVHVHQGSEIDCRSCHGLHGAAPDAELIAQECGRCHAEHPLGGVHEDMLACSECHGSHEIRSVSADGPRHLVSACEDCHDDVSELWRGDVHGSSFGLESERRGADCVDCHGGHQVVSPYEDEFRSVALERCARCHEKATRQANNTYHIKARALGSQIAAGCSDCHGSHDIYATDNPESWTSPERLVETCSECHEHASESFVLYQPHPDPTDRAKNPYVFYSFWFMNALLIGVLGVFLLHTAFWWLRLYLDHRHERGREDA